MHLAGNMADDLRVVRFEDPQACLSATKDFDDSFMNFCIGSLLDHLNKANTGSEELGNGNVYLFGVYREDELLYVLYSDYDPGLLATNAKTSSFHRLCLTKNQHDFAWMMSFVLDVEGGSRVQTGVDLPGKLEPNVPLACVAETTLDWAYVDGFRLSTNGDF